MDLGDYIAKGNNITYSVNKLFRRSIWQEHRYERMLFEDIALIPALVTQCRSLGYVSQPFYNYYRRSGTISTSSDGGHGGRGPGLSQLPHPVRPGLPPEEAVYCAARQLLWNMTQSRTLFLPDFIGLLQEFEADFRLNPYLKEDQETGRILEYLDRPVIPERFLCAHCRRELPQELRQRLAEDFPRGELVEIGEDWLSREDLPACVREAASQENWGFVEEYFSLLALWEGGGMVLSPDALPQLNLNRRRMESCFFGFETQEELTDLCFGAVPRHYVIQALLNSYREDRVHNRLFLPLTHRIRDFLITQMGFQMNGHRQVREGVTLHLPSVLAYDLQDGENCCKRSLPAAGGL